jgi:hypothetical protein
MARSSMWSALARFFCSAHVGTGSETTVEHESQHGVRMALLARAVAALQLWAHKFRRGDDSLRALVHAGPAHESDAVRAVATEMNILWK